MSSKFDFNKIEITEVIKEISTLDGKKNGKNNGTFKNIPAKLLLKGNENRESNIDECGPYSMLFIWSSA